MDALSTSSSYYVYVSIYLIVVILMPRSLNCKDYQNALEVLAFCIHESKWMFPILVFFRCFSAAFLDSSACFLLVVGKSFMM